MSSGTPLIRPNKKGGPKAGPYRRTGPDLDRLAPCSPVDRRRRTTRRLPAGVVSFGLRRIASDAISAEWISAAVKFRVGAFTARARPPGAIKLLRNPSMAQKQIVHFWPTMHLHGFAAVGRKRTLRPSVTSQIRSTRPEANLRQSNPLNASYGDDFLAKGTQSKAPMVKTAIMIQASLIA
jgi:hypothetical protein